MRTHSPRARDKRCNEETVGNLQPSATEHGPKGTDSSNGQPKIDKYFKAMMDMGASDLHLEANSPARFRMNGSIRKTENQPLSNEKVESLIFEIMNDQQRKRYAEKGAMDFAHQLGDLDRFRINVFRQRGLTSVAARRVPIDILGYDELHLPPILRTLADLQQGLILVAGITGSGKSTTIAAMLEQINCTRACHMVTIEDPIEFLYVDKKAFVNQREVGLDVEDFADALKYLMREDPDVVLIGEMRDHETFAAALHAAESGHLVFGTVHSSTTASTITRVLELFPEEARGLIRSSLVLNLQAIVCQKLLPGLDPKAPRVPAVEIMLCNSTVRKLIAEGRENEIQDVIRGSREEGMIDFTEALKQLVDKESISTQTAYAVAPNPDELKMALKGIRAATSAILS